MCRWWKQINSGKKTLNLDIEHEIKLCQNIFTFVLDTMEDEIAKTDLPEYAKNLIRYCTVLGLISGLQVYVQKLKEEQNYYKSEG